MGYPMKYALLGALAALLAVGIRHQFNSGNWCLAFGTPEALQEAVDCMREEA